MLEIKKILYPCDLTQHSTKILPYVMSLAEKYGSEVVLVHVVQDLSEWGGFFVPHLSFDLLQKEAVEAAEKAIDRLCEEKLAGCPGFKRRIVVGNPSHEVLKVIESEKVDMVVVGTHGATGLEHRVFGSVAENIVRMSPVPVLVINPHKLPKQ